MGQFRINPRHLSQFLPLLLSGCIFVASIWTLNREIERHNPQAIWQSLLNIPDAYLIWAIALVAVNYWVLTGYDTLAVRYICHTLPYRKTALVSTVTYAISNTVGITLLSGSAIRFRFYTNWGFSPLQIAQIVAFCNLSFWLGLLTMGGVLFLTDAIVVPDAIQLPMTSLRSLGLFSLVTVAAYLVLSAVVQRSLRIGRLTIPRLTWPMAIAQIVLTCLDWSLAAATIYALMTAEPLPSFPTFLGIYIFAQLAGVLSSVPGGLGVFETVMLLMLSPPISGPTLIGSLLVFRVIHFFAPLAIAMVVLGLFEVKQIRQRRS